MADIDGNDICEVVLQGNVGGTDEIVQVYQFRLDEAHGGLSIEQAFSDWAELLESLWDLIKALYTVQVNFRSIRARNITQQTLLGVAAIDPVFAGTNVDDQLPYQTTIPVAFATQQPRVILKKMLGPMAANSFEHSGFATAAAQTAAILYGVLLLSEFGMTWGTWFYGYNSPISLSFLEPTAVSVTHRPGGLNRRRPGRGS